MPTNEQERYRVLVLISNKQDTYRRVNCGQA